MREREVPIDDLVIDRSKNCRGQVGDVAELADSIAAQGLLHRPTVRRRADGRWDLVAGFTRVEALRFLGWTTVPVLEWDGDDVERAVVNLRENLERRDLTSYEIALACHRLAVEHGLSTAEIAARTRLSAAHVSNCRRAMSKLEPSLLVEWKRGHPAATFDRMVELAAYPRDMQLEQWAELVGIATPRPHAAEVVDVRRPTRRQLVAAMRAVGEQDDTDWRRGATDALEFALGRTRELGTHRTKPRRVRRRRAQGEDDDAQDHGPRAAGVRAVGVRR